MIQECRTGPWSPDQAVGNFLNFAEFPSLGENPENPTETRKTSLLLIRIAPSSPSMKVKDEVPKWQDPVEPEIF